MKLREKRRPIFNIQVFFTLAVMFEIVVTVIFSVRLADVLDITLDRSTRSQSILWLMLFSAVIGSVCAALMNLVVLAPIKKLNISLREVAKGNFNIKLETSSQINEVRDIYQSFNLMEKELAATEILKTDFISNVSHEFKTPITAIEGYATLLQDDDLSEADRRLYTERILMNTGRLSELVGNILLLSRVENRAIQTPDAFYSLDEQIRQVIVEHEQKWSAKNIDLDVCLDDASYYGNESLMRHVWSNLIDNAVKFSPEGGRVRVLLTAEKGIVFIIDDEGPGITDADMKHIFDKFYQSDSSHRQEGNGLGLALVRRILESCGGEVYAENLPEGGCRFTVRLPKKEEA